MDERTQEQRQADRQEAERKALRQEDEDLRRLMAEAWGRRVIYQMLAEAGVWKTSFRSDSMEMAFAEGQRNMGLMLTDKVCRAAGFDQYHQMLKENADG
jgi:hypothetical protein